VIRQQRTCLDLQLNDGHVFAMHDEAASLVGDDRGRGAVVIEVVFGKLERVFVICLVLRHGDLVFLVDCLPADIVAGLLVYLWRRGVIVGSHAVSEGRRARTHPA